jgi:catechol 2,3-dioxygenase-like lactoylglutathione lyase family enzyme
VLELSRDDLDVGMVAHDIEAMLHFYGDVVGLQAAGRIKLPGLGVIHKFIVGGSIVKVFEAEASLGLRDEIRYPWTSAGLNYWSLHVRDLDPLVARLTENGSEPIGGITDTGTGIRYTMVRDPDGNVVEFIEGDGEMPPAPSDRPNRPALA